MCGICGLFFLKNGRKVDADLIRKMVDTMFHRGPDDYGVYIRGQCGLGHRRLSIIDIRGGHQPMTVGNGGHALTIVYNGEIYNYLDLKCELSKLGHKFTTKSDTEVILYSYKEWGDECVNRLQGMFSFGIWDEDKRSLFIARDRLGIKPLYYYMDDDIFLFGSEIKAMLNSNLLDSGLEYSALDPFLTLGYVPAPKTMFKDIMEVLPGYTMSIEGNGKVKISSYWNLAGVKPVFVSFEDAQERLKDLLRESVRMRLMSELPLGVFLSGGLDSSAITALMFEIVKEPIKTFSVGYEDAAEANELHYARKVADLFQTEHHEYLLKPYDLFEGIPELVSTTEEPIVETAAIPLHYISKKAKAHATVLLSGEGADEVFAGYGLYRKMLNMEKVGFLSKFLKGVPVACTPGDKLNKYIDWMSNQLADRYRGTSADLTKRIKQQFYSNDLMKYAQEQDYLEEVFSSLFNDVAKQSALSQLLYVDTKTWLPNDLLLKADKMTMATSVELRVPFLDHKIVEFSASLPPEYKTNNGEGKFILKKLMDKYLPKDIVYRKKMGFTVPTKRWFAGDLLGPAKDIVFSKRLMDTGWFQRKYLEKMFERHSKGKEDYSRRIFSLLVLYHWLDIYT